MQGEDTGILTDSSDSDMLESLSYLVFSLWKTRKLHISTDFSVIGWILCVIPHIFKDAKDHSDTYNRKQANNLINTFFSGLSEDDIYFTQDIFWTEYNEFNKNIGSFYGDGFIWKIKYIRYVNSHLWHQKYSPTYTKVLGFVACRVTSKFLVIGSAECSWGYEKTIK